MKRFTFLVFGLAVALPAVLCSAQPLDPIAERQDLMKHNRDALKPMVGMVKGELPFDAAIVAEGWKVMRHTADTAGELFPEGSETGGDTEARSTIWSDRAGFEKAMSDFGAAVDEAIAANPANVEQLQTTLGGVTKACKGCHDDYRVEKD